MFEQDMCQASHALWHGDVEGEIKYRPVTTPLELNCYENEVTNLRKFGLPQQVRTEEATPWTKKATLSK